MKRKILITGAGRGIGKAEAQRLSPNNELFLHASKQSSFENNINNAHYYGYDFSEIENVEAFVNELKTQTDNIDVLINNVGIMILENFQDFKDEDINTLITLNLHSHLLLTKKLIPMLLKSTNPHIVFMSSMSAKNQIEGESVYAATKAGLMQFAHVLRNELAGKIRVSTIHSWGVNTWGDPEGSPILVPENIAEVIEFILDRERPFVIESVDLSHELQWKGTHAPWSPEKIKHLK
ncbi:MAG: SDR family oxidoreductase [Bacteroidales bacterium]|nr:SDR family oxidoreductase [Bacteroidales bacterium]